MLLSIAAVFLIAAVQELDAIALDNVGRNVRFRDFPKLKVNGILGMGLVLIHGRQ
jgi:hypothetical protein